MEVGIHVFLTATRKDAEIQLVCTETFREKYIVNKSVNYRNNERLNSHIAQFKHYNFQQVGVWPSKERITILDNSVPCNAMTNEGGLYL